MGKEKKEAPIDQGCRLSPVTIKELAPQDSYFSALPTKTKGKAVDSFPQTLAKLQSKSLKKSDPSLGISSSPNLYIFSSFLFIVVFFLV